MAGINQFFVPAKMPNIGPFFQLPQEQLQKYMETQQMKQDINKALFQEGVATSFNYIPHQEIAADAANIYEDIYKKANEIISKSSDGDMRNLGSDIYNFRKNLQSRISSQEGDIYRHISNYNAFKNYSEQLSDFQMNPKAGYKMDDVWKNQLINSSIEKLRKSYAAGSPSVFAGPNPLALDMEEKFTTYLDDLEKNNIITKNDYALYKDYYFYGVKHQRAGKDFDKVVSILDYKMKGDPAIKDHLRQGFEIGMPGYQIANEQGQVDRDASFQNLGTFFIKDDKGNVLPNPNHPFSNYLMGSALEHSTIDNIDEYYMTAAPLKYQQDQDKKAEALYPTETIVGQEYTDAKEAQKDYQQAAADYATALKSGTPEQQAAALEKLKTVSTNAGYSEITKYMLTNTALSKEQDPDLYKSINNLLDQVILSEGEANLVKNQDGSTNVPLALNIYLSKKFGEDISNIKNSNGESLTPDKLVEALTEVGIVDNTGATTKLDINSAFNYLKQQGYNIKETGKVAGILTNKSSLEDKLTADFIPEIAISSGGPGSRKTEKMFRQNPTDFSQVTVSTTTVPSTKEAQKYFIDKKEKTSFDNSSDVPENWDTPKSGDSWATMMKTYQQNGITITNASEPQVISQGNGYITWGLKYVDNETKAEGTIQVTTKEKLSNANAKQYRAPEVYAQMTAFDNAIQLAQKSGNAPAFNALNTTKLLAYDYNIAGYEAQDIIDRDALELENNRVNLKQEAIHKSELPFSYRLVRGDNETQVFIKNTQTNKEVFAGTLKANQPINFQILAGLIGNNYNELNK